LLKSADFQLKVVLNLYLFVS